MPRSPSGACISMPTRRRASVVVSAGVMAIVRPSLRPWTASHEPVYSARLKKRQMPSVLGGTPMTSTIRPRLLGMMFALAAVAGFSAGAAMAQKQGGTLTVGLELDIAGFDPLKV